MIDAAFMRMSERLAAVERELERRQVEVPYVAQVRAIQTGTQSIAYGTITTLLYDTDSYDPDGFHSTSSNTGNFVCPTDGLYVFGVYVVWTPDATGERWLIANVNGVTAAGVTLVPAETQQHWMTIETQYRCTADDVITFSVFQSRGAGTALDVIGGSGWVARIAP